jgi:hypothetical protein
VWRQFLYLVSKHTHGGDQVSAPAELRVPAVLVGNGVLPTAQLDPLKGGGDYHQQQFSDIPINKSPSRR